MTPEWLEWTRKLQSIAQIGLTYATDPFDRERYEQVRQIAAEMLAAGTGVEPIDVVRLYLEDTGYATPKVDVRGVVIHEGRILMVRERDDGCWSLPGGWANVGEAPGVGVVREVWEESGYHVRATRLLAVYDRNKHDYAPHPSHIYKLFFQCELEGGSATESVETDAIGFFAPDDLPPLSISRASAAHIRRFFELVAHPEWPADFD